MKAIFSLCCPLQNLFSLSVGGYESEWREAAAAEAEGYRHQERDGVSVPAHLQCCKNTVQPCSFVSIVYFIIKWFMCISSCNKLCPSTAVNTHTLSVVALNLNPSVNLKGEHDQVLFLWRFHALPVIHTGCGSDFSTDVREDTAAS